MPSSSTPAWASTQPLLVERVAANGLTLHLVANSHGHIDHVFDNAPLVRASGRRWPSIRSTSARLAAPNNYGLEMEPSVADPHLAEGEQLQIGDLVFDVLHTPGHTEGSVCLYEERAGCCSPVTCSSPAPTAAPICPAATTRPWSPSLARLARDLPPEVRVLPGHGPETTIGRELPWMERIAAAGRLWDPRLTRRTYRSSIRHSRRC